MVNVDQVRSKAEGFQGVLLGGEVLLLPGCAGASDQEFIRNPNGVLRPIKSTRAIPSKAPTGAKPQAACGAG